MPEAISIIGAPTAEPVTLRTITEEATLITTTTQPVALTVGDTGEVVLVAGEIQPVALTAGGTEQQVVLVAGPTLQPVTVTSNGEVGPQGSRGDTGPVGPAGGVGPAGPPSDASHYRHVQDDPAAVWVVQHNLGYRPAVCVEDSAGSVVIGDVLYVDANQLTITFDAAFGGYANLS